MQKQPPSSGEQYTIQNEAHVYTFDDSLEPVHQASYSDKSDMLDHIFNSQADEPALILHHDHRLSYKGVFDGRTTRHNVFCSVDFNPVYHLWAVTDRRSCAEWLSDQFHQESLVPLIARVANQNDSLLESITHDRLVNDLGVHYTAK